MKTTAMRTLGTRTRTTHTDMSMAPTLPGAAPVS